MAVARPQDKSTYYTIVKFHGDRKGNPDLPRIQFLFGHLDEATVRKQECLDDDRQFEVYHLNAVETKLPTLVEMFLQRVLSSDGLRQQFEVGVTRVLLQVLEVLQRRQHEEAEPELQRQLGVA